MSFRPSARLLPAPAVFRGPLKAFSLFFLSHRLTLLFLVPFLHSLSPTPLEKKEHKKNETISGVFLCPVVSFGPRVFGNEVRREQCFFVVFVVVGNDDKNSTLRNGKEVRGGFYF